MKERRRFQRQECDYSINYATEGVASIIGSGRAENISKLGMRIPVSRVVRKGSTVRLSIHPVDKTSPVFATGKVRWIKEINTNSRFTVEAGIEFLEIDPAKLDELITVAV